MSGKGIGQMTHYFNQFDLENAGLPSNVKEILAKVNDYQVQSITIGRNPVQSAIQGILKTVSTVPYDNLFHLFLIFNCTNGKKVLLEKNSRINMSMTIPKIEESILISNVPHYTIKEYVAKTKAYMGPKFIPYHPSTNNCQDFILSVLKANGISQGHDFVKQDTEMIFKNKGWLSGTAKNITDLGGYGDVVLRGGLIKNMRAGKLSNELTDADIDSLAKQFKIPHFKGCFLKTEIPKLKIGESVIINLNGHSHWTALIRLDDYFYFDSFGVIAPRELENLTYIYTETDLQSMASSACGFYCLAFLISMNRNGNDNEKKYREFIDAFKGPEKNDTTLKKRFMF